MTTYDLTTARGVLMALADGHELRSTLRTQSLSVDGNTLVFAQSDAPDQCVCLTHDDAQQWFLAPKAVESMDVPELARELYGDVVESCERDFPCVRSEHSVMISAPTRADLLKQLRVLVRAKRAGEL